MNITWKGSPNHTEGRQGKKPSLVVMHWLGAGNLDTANARFQNKANQVSAHYGISDDTVWQWVKEESTAYHSGNWQMNLDSIGIEHHATPTYMATEKTITTAANLLREICKRWDIPLDRKHIILHKEVKATQCPGTLPVDRIIELAKKEGSVSKILTVEEAREAYRKYLRREPENEQVLQNREYISFLEGAIGEVWGRHDDIKGRAVKMVETLFNAMKLL